MNQKRLFLLSGLLFSAVNGCSDGVIYSQARKNGVSATSSENQAAAGGDESQQSSSKRAAGESAKAGGVGAPTGGAEGQPGGGNTGDSGLGINAPSGGQKPTPAGNGVVSVTGGLEGGHFDLDTFSRRLSSGFVDLSSEMHTHEYDDKYNVTGVDYFSLRGSHVGINATVSQTARFVLVVINSGLSNKAVITINGKSVYATDYEQSFTALLKENKAPVFSLSDIAQPDSVKLTGLSLGFAKDAIPQMGIVGFRDSKPLVGSGALYRSGALVVRAVAADKVAIDTVTQKVSTKADGVLWESALYRHLD